MPTIETAPAWGRPRPGAGVPSVLGFEGGAGLCSAAVNRYGELHVALETLRAEGPLPPSAHAISQERNGSDERHPALWSLC